MKKITTLLLLLVSVLAFSQTTETESATTSVSPITGKFMFSASAGPSVRVGKIPAGIHSSERKYLKELKSGFSYDISAYYLKDKRTAYFLRYNAYKSSGSFRSEGLVDPSGQTGPGIAKDDITITFIGVGGLLQERGFRKLDKVSVEVALGYIGYVNNATILNNYKITGGNLGLSSTVGYHFAVSPKITVGPAISFTGGVLKKFKLKGNGISETIELPDDSGESLYRFDLSLMARIAI